MRNPGLACLLLVASLTVRDTGQGQPTKNLHASGGAQIKYEEFGESSVTSCLILLHGAGGSSVPFYKEQAAHFGGHGFHVLMPHYFDATRSSSPTTENYHAWAHVAEEFVSECRRDSSTQKVFLLGYSLGSSIALAAGSEGTRVDAIAEWYGSLPDEFFKHMKGMPPLLILHGERDSNIPIINAQQ
ncbi:MAG: alpha/beta fold hydrolase, partial [Terracidiphilus sp.]